MFCVSFDAHGDIVGFDVVVQNVEMVNMPERIRQMTPYRNMMKLWRIVVCEKRSLTVQQWQVDVTIVVPWIVRQPNEVEIDVRVFLPQFVENMNLVAHLTCFNHVVLDFL
jgi:hypothetical protein